LHGQLRVSAGLALRGRNLLRRAHLPGAMY
jgi:hypothetical protein